MQDLRSLSQSVGTLLKQREQTVAVAESSAGGLISAALLSIPGASAYFLGGSVVYTRVAQRALLGVPDEGMAGLRASTEDYALLNARTVRESLGATWGLSETGVSGPAGNRYGDDARPRVHRGGGPRRGVDHPGDGCQHPRAKYVDVCGRGPRPAGAVREGRRLDWGGAALV
jgi:nicotinamide-nucleotide amidase